ncbi:MAG: DUF4214 domain-containing protein, partial [Marinobacterium sp.]
LTSAHVVATLPAEAWEVIFERGLFDADRSVSHIIVHPDYDSQSNEADLALIRLSSKAPSDTREYSVALDSPATGVTITLQGYGDRLASDSYGFWTGVPLLQSSYNTLDAYGEEFGTNRNAATFAFDYDDGSNTYDSLGWMYDVYHSGLGSAEGFIGPGDSGGAVFYNSKLTGIISHITEYSGDMEINGSRGEIGHAQNLSHYIDWIANYVPAVAATLPEPEPKPEPKPEPEPEPEPGTWWRPGQKFMASKQQVEALALLYEAGLDRRPDEAGLNYWIDRYEDGTALADIADGFLYSAEFGGYPEYQSLFISRLYENVLNRAPDLSGYQYWSNEMQHGLDYADVLLRFAESAENRQQSDVWLETLTQSHNGDWFLG